MEKSAETLEVLEFREIHFWYSEIFAVLFDDRDRETWQKVEDDFKGYRKVFEVSFHLPKLKELRLLNCEFHPEFVNSIQKNAPALKKIVETYDEDFEALKASFIKKMKL